MRTSVIKGAVIVLVLACGVRHLSAAPATKPSATFNLVAHNSSPGGIAPTHNAGETWYKYTFSVPQGSALSDSINIDVCLQASSLGSTAAGDPVPWTDEVATHAPAGAFSSDIGVATPPWSFSSASNVNGDCQTATLTISIPASATTTVGGFDTNVKFKTQNGTPSTGPTQLQDSIDGPDTIKIFVNVTPVTVVQTTFCYLTDSSGNFLADCDGNLVNASGNSSPGDGRFSIVAKQATKKSPQQVEVATNPGQFYYNLLWLNTTGLEQTLSVAIAKTGLNANGAQAVHWLTFATNPDPNPSAGLTGFGDVIEGNPAGTSGNVSGITVPAGHTLYVTFHLEYAGLGSPVPSGCGNGCLNANQPVSVTGTLSGNGISEACTSGALGYLKQ